MEELQNHFATKLVFIRLCQYVLDNKVKIDDFIYFDDFGEYLISLNEDEVKNTLQDTLKNLNDWDYISAKEKAIGVAKPNRRFSIKPDKLKQYLNVPITRYDEWKDQIQSTVDQRDKNFTDLEISEELEIPRVVVNLVMSELIQSMYCLYEEAKPLSGGKIVYRQKR